MDEKKQEKANRLLEGLIEHLCQKMAPQDIPALVDNELTFFLQQGRQYTLNQWVSVEQIQTTARKYAVEMPISGAIPELVGDMVERFYDHAVQENQPITQVLDEQAVTALLDKTLEIPLSRRSVAWLGSNPVLLAALAGGVQVGAKTLFHQGLPGPLRAQLARRLPERWLASLEARLQEWLLRRTEHLLSDPYLYRDEHLDEIRDLVTVAWQDFSQRPVAELRELVSSEDIQELFVIVFEYWRELRHTDYFNALLDAGVQAFFDKYGETSLTELLVDELGVTQAMMQDDAIRFLPPIITRLQDEGIMQQWLRRQLADYFMAEETLALLEHE